jgi:hypothetical protein
VKTENLLNINLSSVKGNAALPVNTHAPGTGTTNPKMNFENRQSEEAIIIPT